jgi:hypothetical protein
MGSIVRWLFPRNAQRGIGSRAAKHRLDEPARLSLGMVASPAEPASVSPGKFIVAPPRHAVLNFQVAGDPLGSSHKHTGPRCLSTSVG